MTAAAPAKAEIVTAEELAERYGVAIRTVRYWIRRGLPATKDGTPPRWQIDLAAAAPWIAGNARAGLPSTIAALPDPAPAADPTAGGESQPGRNGTATPEPDDGGLAHQIRRLTRLLDGFTELCFSADGFDPRLVTGVRNISAELRRLETHRLEMRRADASLMERRDHVRVLGTFGRLVVDEIQAWARTTGDAVIDALTDAGVKLDAKRVAKSLDLALEGKAVELRERLAEAIDQAQEIE